MEYKVNLIPQTMIEMEYKVDSIPWITIDMEYIVDLIPRSMIVSIPYPVGI